MKLRGISVEQRRDVIADASRADLGSVSVLRAMGDDGRASAMTPAKRDELLAKLKAGEYVELELELLAYSQETGLRNRKSVRFRDGALMSLGRSGKGNPFLRDHDQGNALARGGTITASATDKIAEGKYAIRQTVKLTAPWAVELALLGLLDTLSIGWNPTGPIECSVCGTEIFTDCYHWRGDVVTDDSTGAQRVVEWVITEAELVETSAVSVPAVPSAHIEGIRAAFRLSADDERGTRGALPQRNNMDPKLKLLALLGLAATASDSEALRAVEVLSAERDALRAQNVTLTADHKALAAQVALAADEKRAKDEDAFIASAIELGKVKPGGDGEKSLRAWFSVAPDAAKKHVEALPAVTLAGVKPQRQEGERKPGGGSKPAPAEFTAADLELQQHGYDPSIVKRQLRKLGIKDPDASLERYAPSEEEV